MLAFAETASSSALNGVFTKDYLKGMLELKEYLAGKTVYISSKPSQIDSSDVFNMITNQHSHHVHPTPNHSHRCSLLSHGNSCNSIICQSFVHECKQVLVETFSHHWKMGLFTLKFHPLDHMAPYTNPFRRLNFLDASSFEHFKMTINQSFRSTSLRHGTRTAETVRKIVQVGKEGCIAA